MLTHEEMRTRIETESRSLEIQYPMQVKQMTNEETKAKYRNRLVELSKPHDDLVFWVDGTVTCNGELVEEEYEDLTEEQKQWVRFRLTHPNTWPKVRENKIGDHKNWQ